jgi:hypothetical protein
MTATAAAMHFRARHKKGVIIFGFNRAWQWPIKARPARASCRTLMQKRTVAGCILDFEGPLHCRTRLPPPVKASDRRKPTGACKKHTAMEHLLISSRRRWLTNYSAFQAFLEATDWRNERHMMLPLADEGQCGAATHARTRACLS